jgi:hypothetical protein
MVMNVQDKLIFDHLHEQISYSDVKGANSFRVKIIT